MQIAHCSKRLIFSGWKQMQIKNIQNSIIKLFSCSCSHYVTFKLSISQLFSLCSSKNLFYTGNELEKKEFNCKKAGFRAIHTENNADMFILWPCIINGATEFSMHQWNFLSWHCLELKSINVCHFKGFLWLSRSQDINFLWNRFLQVVSFSMKQRRQKV